MKGLHMITDLDLPDVCEVRDLAIRPGRSAERIRAIARVHAVPKGIITTPQYSASREDTRGIAKECVARVMGLEPGAYSGRGCRPNPEGSDVLATCRPGSAPKCSTGSRRPVLAVGEAAVERLRIAVERFDMLTREDLR